MSDNLVTTVTKMFPLYKKKYYHKKEIKFFLRYAKKIIRIIFKSLFKITTYHVLWIITAVFFYGVLTAEPHNYEDEENEKVHNYSRAVDNGTVLEIENTIETHTVHSEYPILTWWTGFEFNRTVYCPGEVKCQLKPKRYLNNADGYLFYASKLDFKQLPLPRRPNRALWALLHEESPRNVKELLHEKALSLFNYSATFSRHSDIPFPLNHMESLAKITGKQYFVETAVKNSYLREIAPVLYIQSDCQTMTERDSYVKRLMNYIHVDSYGSCLKNKSLPRELYIGYLNQLSSDKMLKFVARYKFTIAIENGVCDDYVTEKFWRPIIVGSVPIYFGSSLIKDWLPNTESAIMVEDFRSPKKLSKYLKSLMRSDKLYEKHLEHKINGRIMNTNLATELAARPYQTDFLKIMTLLECMVCKGLHDKRTYEGVKTVKKSAYNCHKPVVALTRRTDPSSFWVRWYEEGKPEVMKIYNMVASNP